ncbi:SHOCT domain-containing protein [Nonomuraea aurantiaca]|uniref:SHOCT domain-containing protein n=1 Tax=Nonomuraea aurantiaca TaxID=2878562 RepID=UPI001CD97AB1|nr:SHOCT domain-containing protein [Nonomuraea aurantiaca]MCA2225430.1 SHOCT domain-containing protein [Nonomuraea aurantiaca]
MNTMTHWGWGAGFWPIIPVVWGLFWVAVVALAARTWQKGRWQGGRWQRTEAGPTTSAERILAERYARGEMTDDEYFERMSVLKS